MPDTHTRTQHTRKPSIAPWFVAHESVGRWEVYSRGTDGSYSVASCVKEVDARLIASAPDMLAALEAARRAMADEIASAELIQESPLMRMIAAAIAKARGEE